MKFGDAALEPESREYTLFARLVHDLITNKGFVFPLHLVTLNATGAMSLGRWTQEGEVRTFTPITHHFPPEGEGLESEMYIVVVDTKGLAFMISLPDMVRKYLAEEKPTT